MSNVEVSVVIPSYGRAEWLIHLLKSLSKNQLDHEKYEVIVVDDGSPNGDEKEKRICTHQWPFAFTYLRQENSGPAKARNHGAKQAKAKFIAFLDDDTVVHPGWMSQIIKGYKDGIVGIAGKVLVYKVETLTERFLHHEQHLVRHQFSENGDMAYVCTANCSFLREAFESINGFNDTLRSHQETIWIWDFDYARRGTHLDITKTLLSNTVIETPYPQCGNYFLYLARCLYVCKASRRL